MFVIRRSLKRERWQQAGEGVALRGGQRVGLRHIAELAGGIDPAEQQAGRVGSGAGDACDDRLRGTAGLNLSLNCTRRRGQALGACSLTASIPCLQFVVAWRQTLIDERTSSCGEDGDEDGVGDDAE